MPVDVKLSDRQKAIISFIQGFFTENAYPPTIREIGKAVGIPSTSVVKYNLERLQEKGHIERSEEVSRGLRLKEWPGMKPLPPRLRREDSIEGFRQLADLQGWHCDLRSSISS